MRILLLIFLIVCSLNAFASDHSYGVSGEDENGQSVEGTVDSTNGDRSVSGELTYENGDTHEFDGEWDGHGQISGETDDGVAVDLNTN